MRVHKHCLQDIFETGGSSFVFTASEVVVESAEHMEAIIAAADRERKTARTEMNAG